MEKYSHLINTEWDKNFITNPPFFDWFEAQLKLVPIAPGIDLQDYVRARIAIQTAESQSNRLQMTTPNSTDNSSSSSNTFNSTNNYNQSLAPQQTHITSNSSIASDMSFMDSYSSFISPSTTSNTNNNFASTSTSIPPTQPSYESYDYTSASIVPTPPPPQQQQQYYNPLNNKVTPFTNRNQPTTSKPSTGSALSRQAEIITNERSKIVSPATATSTSTSIKSTSVPSTSTSTIKKSTPTSTQPVASTSKLTSTSTPTSSSTLTKPTKAPVVEATDLDGWLSLLPSIREQLTTSRITKAPSTSIKKLGEYLSMFSLSTSSSSNKNKLSSYGDYSSVPPESRVEIIEAILSSATDDYLNSFVKEESLMKVLKIWLNGATEIKPGMSGSGKGKEKEVVKSVLGVGGLEITLRVILLLFDKLPMTSEILAKYSVGARVLKVANQSSDPILAALAKKIVDRWMTFVKAPTSSVTEKRKSTSSTESAANKKSKPTPTPVVPKVVPTPVTFAKPSLPSFKKVPTVPVQPLSTLEAALFSMKKAGSSSGSTTSTSKPSTSNNNNNNKSTNGGRNSTPEIILASSGKVSALSSSKLNFKKSGLNTSKRVRFNDENLVSIKWIPDKEGREQGDVVADADGDADGDEEMVDDDENEANERSLKDMAEQEGTTLTLHFEDEMEEEVTWYNPIDVVVPDTEDFASFNQEPDSPEAVLQTARDLTSIVSEEVYEQDSPNEPIATLHYTEADNPTLSILLSSDLLEDLEVQRVIADAQVRGSKGTGYVDNAVLVNLLSQLSAPPPPAPSIGYIYGAPTPHGNWSQTQQQQQQQQQQQASPISNDALAMLRTFDPVDIANLVQSTPGLNNLAGQLNRYGITPPNVASTSSYNDYNPPSIYTNPLLPPPITVPSAWDSTINAQQYKYNSTYAPTTEIATAPKRKRGAVVKGAGKGRRGSRSGGGGKSDVCSYFLTSRGCDWGDKCRNRH